MSESDVINEALDLETDNIVEELGEPDSDSSVNLIQEDKQLWKAEEDDGSRFSDFGALDGVLKDIRSSCLIQLFKGLVPVELESKFMWLKNIRGWLLIGPSGCGKTKLAHAIANEASVPFYKVSAARLLSGADIKYLFSQAIKTEPSIVFIDDLHEIGHEPEGRSIVSQLKAFMDGSLTHYVKGKKLLLIGATHSPDALDPSLTRSGRFEQFNLSVRGVGARVHILTVLTRSLKVKVEGSLNLVRLATATPGFIGADLRSLVDKAVRSGVGKFFYARKFELSNENTNTKEYKDFLREKLSDEEMEKISITMSDFEAAAKQVRPAFRLQNPTRIPDVMWEDVGGLDKVKKTLNSGIVHPIEYPEEFEEKDIGLVTGFLLYGPPGCGKTLIANAVANKAGASFISITGLELVTPLEVQKVFSHARRCSPCILLIDYVDGIVSPRNEGKALDQQVMYQLFTELEAAFEHKGVFIIGATDRPEVLDNDILKRKRFGKCLYVPLPNPDERVSILKALGRKMVLDTDVDLVAIGRSDHCKNLSGADLRALMGDAGLFAITECIDADAEAGTSKSFLGGASKTIKASHFDQALKRISPSVWEKRRHHYDALQRLFEAERRFK